MPSASSKQKRKNKKEAQDEKADATNNTPSDDSKKDDTAFDMEEALKVFEERYKELSAVPGFSQYPSTSSSTKRSGPNEWKRVSEMLNKALDKWDKK